MSKIKTKCEKFRTMPKIKKKNVKNSEKCQNPEKCQKFRKMSKIQKNVKNSEKIQKNVKNSEKC